MPNFEDEEIPEEDDMINVNEEGELEMEEMS